MHVPLHYALSNEVLKMTSVRIVTLALCSATLLVGCAGKTTAQLTFDAMSSRAASAKEKREACDRDNELAFASERTAYNEKFVISSSDPRRFEKFLSTEYVSDELRPILIRLWSSKPCLRTWIEDIKNDAPQIAQIQTAFLNERDKLRLGLLEGKIHIGDFNKTLTEMVSLMQQQSDTAWNSQLASLNHLHQQESNQRAAAWAAFSQGWARAAEQNAQARQQLLNSMQQSQPTYTNCYMIGNTINCTTR
jgi:hypothetical protein